MIEFADGTLDLPLPPRPVETAKDLAQPSTLQNQETDEADEESAAVHLETGEFPAEPETDLPSATEERRAPELAQEASDSNLEASIEPTKPETPSEPSLQLPADPQKPVKKSRIRWNASSAVLRERICFRHESHLLISSCGSFDTLRKREIFDLQPKRRVAAVSIFVETFFETLKSQIGNRRW